MTVSNSGLSNSGLSSPGQLLSRYGLADLQQHQVISVNASDNALADLPGYHAWSLHAGYHQQLTQQGVSSHFSATPPSVAATAAVVYLPKEKPLLVMFLTALASILPVGAPVWLVGEKRAGIKSLAKQLPAGLQELYSAPQKLTDGNHCSLLQLTLTTQTTFDLTRVQSWVDYQNPLTDGVLKLCTLPGVFAHESVDSGSDYLLCQLPRLKAARVLDFACGAGVLGACLQQQQPELKVTYADVSAIALAATAATLAQQHLTATEIVAVDGLPDTLGKFELIISHPPFHTGVATDYKIGQQFLREARQHLVKRGELWLVANKFLPWPELIEKSFGHCNRVASDNKYAVYRAVNSGTT